MAKATRPTSTSARMSEALLTMDVVDQIRRRESDLKMLGESSHDIDGLKARLRSIYESQGIDVTDAVLEAGIAAQREKRFVYSRPTGFKSWLAKGWINRGAIGKRCAKLAALTVVAIIGNLGISIVTEHLELKKIAGLNAQVDDAIAERRQLEIQLSKVSEGLAEAVARASSAENPNRLQHMSAQAEMAGRAAADRVTAALKAVDVPRLDRRDGRTWLVGMEGASLDGKEAIRPILGAARSELQAARDAVSQISKSTAGLVAGVVASARLDSANAAAIAADLPQEAEVIRKRELTRGDAALRSGEVSVAEAAAGRMERLGTEAAAIAAMTGKLADLQRQGLATGVEGADRDTFEAAVERARGLAHVETADKAGEALGEVERMVQTLGASYTYRVVNRPRVRSGVWRYNHDSPNARNYYLIVEAQDDSGAAVSLPIRSEEDGETREVTVFGVRVPEEAFNRVAADKKDNGVIENDVIGKKARGRIYPDYDIADAGGYITRW